MVTPNLTTGGSTPARRVVAVTGASGFVGRWLLDHLASIAESDDILPLPFFRSGRGSDIADAEAVAEIVKELQPAAVVHLAAVAAPTEAQQDPRQAWKVNVLGTLNIALALRDHAPEAAMVFAGSSEIYGDSFNEIETPLGEDAPLRPLTPYAATKAAADLMLGQMARDGLRCVRFRSFNHTGPGQAEKYAVSAFARQIALIEKGLQQPVIEVGNLTVERDFLDVRDVVRAYAAAASTASIAPGTALNLASGHAVSLGWILETLLSMTDRPIEVSVNPRFLRVGDIPRVCGDASRIARLLDWKPRIPLNATLEAVLNDWRGRV